MLEATPIALAGALSWASGLRLYLALFLAGMLGRLHVVPLPQALDVLSHTPVLIATGALTLVEFLADKIPAFDSLWDGVQTFVRVPAGALLAWGVFAHASPEVQAIAALLGGALAAGTHAAKAGTRALVNTSPEPFSNWGLSFSEDALVVGGLALGVTHPLAFLVVLALFVLLLAWMLPRLWRGMRAAWRRLRDPFGRQANMLTAAEPPSRR